MFKNIKITNKIYILVLIELSLLVLCSGFAISQMTKIRSEAKAITDENIPLVQHIAAITEKT